MMRRLSLILLPVFALPAFAQQPDPGQVFAIEWQGKVLAEQHVADSAQALLRAYSELNQQLSAAKAELDYWHRWCGENSGCARPEEPQQPK